ncbi:Replicase polyprotein 1ab [Labeo rohita]|uniref:Replicase polyprotein 1ab n=1 Tax=Labeo rohita TaxID=84645 RepID=A0ABQ8L0U9_LABRO|nr:Replicase polyprotein 1ab [Labeo rohita]
MTTKRHLWTVSIILTRLKLSIWQVFLMKVNQSINLIQVPTKHEITCVTEFTLKHSTSASFKSAKRLEDIARNCAFEP